MIQDIKFSRTVQAIGRNGTIKQTGIGICEDKTDKTLILEAINYKGKIAKCLMEIPIEDVPAVIAALQMAAELPADPIETLQANYEAKKPEFEETKRALGEFHRAVADSSGDAPGMTFGPE